MRVIIKVGKHAHCVAKERMAIPMGENDRIIRMRKETGMKQVEFAEYFAIPVRTLQEWEHDRRTPPEYLVRLLEYRLRVEGLLGKDGDPYDDKKGEKNKK